MNENSGHVSDARGGRKARGGGREARRALRENDRVWVRDAEGKLRIREVRVLWRREDDVLVRDGFSPGDLLVTTRLTSVVPGMPLAIRGEKAPTTQARDATATRPMNRP